jgi:exosortase
MAGAVLTVTGPDILRRFSAAWCALLFLIPVPGRVRGVIAVPLQQVTADVTAFLLELMALPVEHRGNLLIVNGAEVAVAEACNGMRMVAAMALISYAFVFSAPMRFWARAVLLAASPVIAVLVNVVRLIPTSLLYGYSSQDTADLFHDLAGWGVLALALGGMWGLLALLRYLELPLSLYRVQETA